MSSDRGLSSPGRMGSVGSVIGIYVHHLDPVALSLGWGLTLKWYGLAYLAGFLVGFALLRHLGGRKLWVLKPELAGDFVAAAAMFGVFIGGRLGYMLLYHYPEVGWGDLLKHPLQIVRVWDGGMASHGGILGLVIFTWFYAKKHQVTWTGLGDALCVVAPLGIFFGRMANFINGELYGRVAEGLAWGVKFPLSLVQQPEEVQQAAWDACISADQALAANPTMPMLLERLRHSPELLKIIGEYLPTRHPSQLYEGGLEGLLLFVILWTVRVRCPKAPDGLLTALFFGCYATFRIFGEQFREPDAELVGLLTKGQYFSLFMYLFCLGFLFHAWRRWRAGKLGPGGNFVRDQHTAES